MSFKNPTYKERKKRQEQWNEMQRKARKKYLEKKRNKSKGKHQGGSKKSLRKRLMDWLDRKWSKIIKNRGKCEYCGSKGLLDPHHIVRRSHMDTRWDLKNGVCLCRICHTKLHNSQDFEEKLIEFFKKERGKMWWIKLQGKKNSIKRWTIPKLKEKKNNLKEKWQKIEKN